MEGYLYNFSRSLEDSDFIRLTYQAFGILVAIILLFLIAKLIKEAVNNRIRKISNFSMDFQALKEMRKTGLISDDEYEKVRSGLVKRFTQTPRTEDFQSEEELMKSLPLKPVIEEKKETPATEVALSRPSEMSATSPIDLRDLLKKGLITDEEYKKISEINKKKSAE